VIKINKHHTYHQFSSRDLFWC